MLLRLRFVILLYICIQAIYPTCLLVIFLLSMINNQQVAQKHFKNISKTKMKKLSLVVVCLIATLNFSCKYFGTESTEFPDVRLAGKWVWRQSVGGFTGGTYTPVSTNRNVVIEFSNSTLKTYENGKLESERNYKIETHESLRGGGKKPTLIFSDTPSQAYTVEGNKLFLEDQCSDCFTSEYVR